MDVSPVFTAIVVEGDEIGPFTFRWYGGHGVGIFDHHGEEIDYFTMGTDAPTVDDFESSVHDHVKAVWDT